MVLSAALLGFGMTACHRGDDICPEESRTEIRLTTGIQVQTRAAYPETDVQIPAGELLSVWVEQAGDQTPLYENNVMTAGGDGTLTSRSENKMYFPENGSPVNIYALHTNATWTGNAYPTGTITHKVNEVQKTLANYASSDLLYSRMANVARTKETVPVTLSHLLAKLQIAICPAEGLTAADIQKVTLDGTKLTANLTLNKSTAPLDLEVTASGTPASIEVGTDASTDFTDEGLHYNDVIVVPQTVAAGTAFLTVTLTSGKEVIYRLSSDAHFESGKKYSCHMTVYMNELQLNTSVTDWEPGELISGDNGLAYYGDITDQFNPEFAKVLHQKGYISDPNHITAAEVAGIITLNVNGTNEDYEAGKGLTSLKGIEFFTSLTNLHCGYNQLTVLDMSKNTALIELYCSQNKLTALDISNCTTLTKLYCTNNQLKTLDVSNCIALIELGCQSTKLTTLDVSKNTALIELYCSGNQLTTLNVKNNTALTELSCFNNQLKTLNVSNNTALNKLSCGYNQLTTLDISNNTALTKLNCDNNQLKTLDVSNNIALTELWCYENQLSNLDVNKNTALIKLGCTSNPLTTLNVNNNTALTQLYCQFNQLALLDIRKNTALTLVVCSNNQLTTLDVTKNIALTSLSCAYNQITSLDVSKNTELTRLCCYSNPGDGQNLFPVTAWFDNNHIPEYMKLNTDDSDENQTNWIFGTDQNTITIDFRKAE